MLQEIHCSKQDWWRHTWWLLRRGSVECESRVGGACRSGGRKASRSSFTRSGVGVQRAKPASFCRKTTSVPCAAFTDTSRGGSECWKPCRYSCSCAFTTNLRRQKRERSRRTRVVVGGSRQSGTKTANERGSQLDSNKLWNNSKKVLHEPEPRINQINVKNLV